MFTLGRVITIIGALILIRVVARRRQNLILFGSLTEPKL